MPAKTLAVLVVLLLGSWGEAAPLTFFEMSSRGSYVIPAGEYYYDESDLSFVANNFLSNSSYYQSAPYFGWGGWRLEFGGFRNTPLTTGVYSATRFPFGRPGFDVTGFGRGHNKLVAGFEVLDVAYEGNTPTRFAATFSLNNTMTGRVSYNSEAFFEVPEPTTLGLFALLLGSLATKRTARARFA